MSRKFDLRLAAEMAKNQEAVDHWKVIKETLKAVGVKIVVGQQIAKLVVGAKAAIASANKAIADLRVRDAEDEQGTVRQIGDLRTARDERAKGNAAVIASHGGVATTQQAEIDRLLELAKKFA